MGLITRLRLAGAVRSGKVERVVALLAGGADPNEHSAGGATALMVAAGADQAAVVNALLDHGAAIDARDAQGRTALLHAVQGRAGAAARALLDRGAGADIETVTGETALDIARQTEQVDMLKLLMAARASRRG